MNRIFTLMFALLTTIGISAQNELTIDVATAGTLDTFIPASDKYTITKLTLTGNLNGKDMVLLREMAGSKGINTPTNGILSELDLSGARIVASDDAYFSYSGVEYKSEDDKLGSYMFLYCNKLTRITLPAGLKDIGNMSLSGCSGLTEITIPDNVESIGEGVFTGCEGIKKIIVPNSVTFLGTGAFQRMDNLEEIVLGDGVGELNLSVFLGDAKLKTITFGASIGGVDLIIFNDLLSLTDIYVSDKNENYSSIDGVLVSKDKSELIYYPQNRPSENYTIPADIKLIKDAAFYGATYLTTINIPASVTEIEAGSFANALALSNFVLEEGNEHFAVIDGILYTKTLSRLICVPTALNIEKYITPAEVKYIDYLSFSGNNSIQEICLSDNVLEIGAGAFGYCKGLKKLQLGKNIESIGEIACAGDESLTEVYCYSEDLNDDKVNLLAFADENIMTQCVLYVPKGKVDFYLSQNWVNFAEEGIQFFAEVKEMDEVATSITRNDNDNAQPVSIYDAGGNKLQKQQRGLNIIKMSDGSVRKVLVK